MPSEPPLEEFVAGGTFLVLATTPLHHLSRSVLAPAVAQSLVLTVSSCIAEVLPDMALLDCGWRRLRPDANEERDRVAARFGVATEDAAAVSRWSADAWESGRMLLPHAFADVETARAFGRRFLPASSAARLVGIGLHRSEVDEFLADVERGEVADGFEGVLNGVRDGIARRIPVDPGGRRLGYDVLGVSAGSLHAWHCHGLVDELRARFGALPCPGGLIESYEDATRMAEICDDEGVGCDPGVWRALVVVEYDR